MKAGNLTKHVHVAVVQVHELLEAAEEHIGCALHEETSQEALEVLHSVVRVIEAISVQQPLLWIAASPSSRFLSAGPRLSPLVSI